MLAWNELLTDLAWHEILHRHFRPLQNRKWTTVKWLTHEKQLQEVALWGKLKKKTLLATHFNIFWIQKQAFTHYCHLHEPSLSQQILIGCDKILFSHTQRGYQFLFLYYFIIFRFFCYFTLLLIFPKNILLLLFYYIYIFSWKWFFLSCSWMFRNVPGCSMFRILSTPKVFIFAG